MTIASAREMLDRGEVSSVDLTGAFLERISAVDEKVSAYITVDPEGAKAAAALADKKIAEGAAGPLTGIPLSLKDALSTEGLQTTAGSKILEGFIPPYDATVTARLKEAGAVILGKAAMDEFAMGSSSETCAYGIPRNPWSLDCICGGSSGGSAAAVAAAECLGSIGSDTGGSIRQPASHCGIVGMKPTYGRVSRFGLLAYASSLDQLGPMTRDVADCATLMNIISGHDRRDSTSVDRLVPDYTAALDRGVRGMRIGLPGEYFSAGLDPEVEKIVRATAARLSEAGAELVEVSLPHTDYAVAAYYVIAPAEASSNLSRYDGVRFGHRAAGVSDLQDLYCRSRSEGFGPEVKRRILIGTYALSAGYYDAYYKKALQVRTLVAADFSAAFESCDLLLSPVAPTPAWKIGEKVSDPLAMYLSDILTIPANLAGVPGISVPAALSPAGLPIGVQLMAPHFHEEDLIACARVVEESSPLAGRGPGIAAR